MISLDIFPTTELRMPETKIDTSGLSKLFAAAVVSRQFRDVLLREPEAALKNGYLGQTFPLTEQEKGLIKSIQAKSLTDLAQQVNRALRRGH